MRRSPPNILFCILCFGAIVAEPNQLKADNTVNGAPVYPPNMNCGQITSLFGSMQDLDGNRRDVAHTGIDLGEFGDIVIAPAAGVIGKIWPVKHPWGSDWNLLIIHTANDLNLPDSQSIYYTEFDHLQRGDMLNLKANDRLKQGQQIGVVRHPGNNHRFRAEVHMEVYKIPVADHPDTIWRDNSGFRYWWNASAKRVDPLEMLSKHMQSLAGQPVQVPLYNPGVTPLNLAGFVYPLRCLGN